ncbi:MAG TPA: response regulator [Alphaproteobacteria bacterium]|nr:response regulator [Alphaproteobacteria bacterium]
MQDADFPLKDEPRATILVVEDDALNVALFKEILTARGHELIFAKTGGKALEVLKDLRPDLILMDIVVPEISGLDLIRLVKGDAERRSIPIIAVTSLPARLYKDQIMEAGCDAYVAKPLSVTTLWATIDHLLAESRASEEADSNPLARIMGRAR